MTTPFFDVINRNSIYSLVSSSFHFMYVFLFFFIIDCCCCCCCCCRCCAVQSMLTWFVCVKQHFIVACCVDKTCFVGKLMLSLSSAIATNDERPQTMSDDRYCRWLLSLFNRLWIGFTRQQTDKMNSFGNVWSTMYRMPQ